MRTLTSIGVALALLLGAGAEARADGDVREDLEVRILPQEGAEDGAYRGAVARPFEIRFELRNRGNEPLLLPLGRTPFLRVRIWHESHPRPPILFGAAWGPAPQRGELVEIPPGEAREETRRVTPTMSGEARVVVDLRSSYTEVSEYRRRELGRVKEPRLWHGVLEVSAPLHVAPRGVYDDRDAVDADLVRHLEANELDEVDRLAAIDRIAVLDPTERAVNLLRSGLPPAFTRQGPSRLERWLRAKHLVVAARRGYGYRALPHLLRIVEEKEEHLDVRRMAIEGAALLLDDHFLLRTDDDVYLFRPPPAVQERARLVFAELSAGEGPLAKRAKEIVESRVQTE